MAEIEDESGTRIQDESGVDITDEAGATAASGMRHSLRLIQDNYPGMKVKK